MNNALQIAKEWINNIKPNFTAYYHRGVYANAYGTGALHTCSFINLMLKDTVYELSDSARDNFKKALKNFIKLSIVYELSRTIGARSPYFTNTLFLMRPTSTYFNKIK